MFGVLETVLILAAILLLFGGSRLPALSRGIGRMVKNLRYGLRGDDGIRVAPQKDPPDSPDPDRRNEIQ